MMTPPDITRFCSVSGSKQWYNRGDGPGRGRDPGPVGRQRDLGRGRDHGRSQDDDAKRNHMVQILVRIPFRSVALVAIRVPGIKVLDKRRDSGRDRHWVLGSIHGLNRNRRHGHVRDRCRSKGKK